MNGSRSPGAHSESVVAALQNDDAPAPSINGVHSPADAQSPAEQKAGTLPDPVAGQQDAAGSDAMDLDEGVKAKMINGGHEDAESEAETLIDSPVKKKEAENQAIPIKVDKPIKSRIGSLPVPGDDDEEDSSVATPLQTTEMSDVKGTPSADAGDGDHDKMDVDSDKKNSSSGPLSSAQSSASDPASRSSSRSRALSERPQLARNSIDISNSRKRKHRASSVSLPNKRKSMDPPKRALPGLHSEDNAARTTERSSSPRLRNHHRRAVSTQSAFFDGTAESSTQKRRSITQLPARDPKPVKANWEESDGSSETASHGHIESRRPQRGVGRSTSTPGRPPGREHKRHVNKYGFTRFAEACEAGELDLVREWREKDPEALEVAEFAGNKPLQIAALNGNEEVVEYLIEQGCQIDCANVDKDTPLIDAAENGHLDVVKILLKAGVDPMRQNLKGQQALDVVTDETDHADGIRAALREAIESWNSHDAKQRREEEEEQRHRAGPSKELHFMARTYENLLRLVTNNDRNGVREFLDARVPVDNVVIAAAARTGDLYLVNMLLAEMTEKKAYQKPEKPLLAVLGSSHFEMVNALTQLDQFNPLYRSRAGKTWPVIAEERNGTYVKQEKELLQRLYDERSRLQPRRSSSPVAKRENAKRRPMHHSEVESDENDATAPKRKNGRRLMSRRDMRAASGKMLSDSETDDSASDPAPGNEEPPTMGPPESAHFAQIQQKRPVGRPRTKSVPAQPTEASPKTRRRSSSFRGLQEPPMPTVEEKAEDIAGLQRDEDHGDEAKSALEEAQQAEARQREEAAAKAEAMRAEEEARQAEEQRMAEARRQLEAEEELKIEEERQRREAEEAAKRAEEERKLEEERRQREVEMEDARSNYRRDVLASLPSRYAQLMDPEGDFVYQGTNALSELLQLCTPLLAVSIKGSGGQAQSRENWVLNAQAAPMLGKRGLELLLPSDRLGFGKTFSSEWLTREDVGKEPAEHILSAMTANDRAEHSVDENESFQAEMERMARRRNNAIAARHRLQDGTIPLYLVKLQDIMANLEPLFKDVPIKVRNINTSAQAAEVAATMQKQGVTGFVARMNGFYNNVRLEETYLNGEIDESQRPLIAGRTEVHIVHQK